MNQSNLSKLRSLVAGSRTHQGESENCGMSAPQNNSAFRGSSLNRHLQAGMLNHSVAFRFVAGLACLFSGLAFAGDFGISGLSKGGSLALTNVFTNGVVTVETAPSVTGPWTPVKSAFSLASRADI